MRLRQWPFGCLAKPAGNHHRPRRRLRWYCAPLLLLALLIAAAGWVVGQESSAGTGTTGDHTSLSATGAALFAERCAVCHGATGGGLAEAKEAFPVDHRRCERCHRPGNGPTMSLAQMEARQHDLFSIGEPPELTGPTALAAHASAPALRAYLETAMPRFRPGILSDEEYDALTAFLLQLNGRPLP